MVQVITINNVGDLNTSLRVLNRVKRNIPSMTRKAMQRWGKILERDMRLSAIQAKIGQGVGNSVNHIEWRQGNNSNIGYLFMRKSLIFVDSMRSHFVSITRRRTRLLAWAKSARSPAIRAGAQKIESGAKRGGKLFKFSIYVKKHPFINNGFRRARPKLKPVIKRLINRAVHRA